MRGESLAHRLEQVGPLELEVALQITHELAAALEVVHAAGFVHRDLKPSNVMLSAHGVRLLDFGLAVPAGGPILGAAPSESRITQQGVLLGTPQYMPPEQLEGLACDARSDVYSLGAVLYEMLTGRRVFAARSRARLIADVLYLPPPDMDRDGLPSAVHQLVHRCLEKQADDRWQTMQALTEALGSVSEDS